MYVTNVPIDAATNIKVVHIQNGPYLQIQSIIAFEKTKYKILSKLNQDRKRHSSYKSGLSAVFSVNVPRNGKRDSLSLSTTSEVSTSKNGL